MFFESFTRTVFSFLCHNIPERSPVIAGEIFFLCWRCTGFYFGMAIAFLLWTKIPHRPSLPAAITYLIIGSAYVIDGYLNFFGVLHTPGEGRYFTGILAAMTLWSCALPFWRFSDQPYEPPQHFDWSLHLKMLTGILLAFTLLYFPQKILWIAVLWLGGFVIWTTGIRLLYSGWKTLPQHIRFFHKKTKNSS